MRPSWLRKTEQGCQVTVICCMTKRSLAFQNKKKDHCTRWCNKLYTSSRSCKHFDFNNALKKYPIYQWAWEFIKNSTCGGKDLPHGIVLRRKPSHTGRENPRIPAPTRTRGPSPCELGRTLHVLWTWGRRGDFFNLNLKFTRTGSRTQDLRSATGFP